MYPGLLICKLLLYRYPPQACFPYRVIKSSVGHKRLLPTISRLVSQTPSTQHRLADGEGRPGSGCRIRSLDRKPYCLGQQHLAAPTSSRPVGMDFPKQKWDMIGRFIVSTEPLIIYYSCLGCSNFQVENQIGRDVNVNNHTLQDGSRPYQDQGIIL